MSKTKQRERSEIEHFRGRIKKLESENRQLKKRLRSLDKAAHFYEDLIDAVAEDIIIEEKCAQCKEGKPQVLDLKHVKFITCSHCDFREKI